MMHGLLDSSDTYFINREELAPGYVLANKGFDVWVGNWRGNKHSRKHVELNPDNHE